MEVKMFALNAGGFWHSLRVGITARQFEQMQKRLDGGRRAAAPVFHNTRSFTAAAHQVLIRGHPFLPGDGDRVEGPRPIATSVTAPEIRKAQDWTSRTPA